jgi:hypothetical protein
MKLSMPPEVWGPFFWHTMHLAALGYPEKPTYAQKKAAKEFYESLQFLLPCEVCRKHYSQNLALRPITPSLDSRTDLLKWTIEIHNMVNTQLQKMTLSESEVITYYKRLGSRARSPIWTPVDFAEADMRARIQGLGIGAGITLVACTALWYSTSRE